MQNVFTPTFPFLSFFKVFSSSLNKFVKFEIREMVWEDLIVIRNGYTKKKKYYNLSRGQGGV